MRISFYAEELVEEGHTEHVYYNEKTRGNCVVRCKVIIYQYIVGLEV